MKNPGGTLACCLDTPALTLTCSASWRDTARSSWAESLLGGTDALLWFVSAMVIIAKTLYVGTAILQRKEDPCFAGHKLAYRTELSHALATRHQCCSGVLVCSRLDRYERCLVAVPARVNADVRSKYGKAGSPHARRRSPARCSLFVESEEAARTLVITV